MKVETAQSSIKTINKATGKSESPVALGRLSEAEAVTKQVVEDLKLELSKAKNLKNGLGLLARKSGIHQKTLVRILNFENRPGYLTIFKIYRVLLNTEIDNEVLERAPLVIQEFLKKYNPQKVTAKVQFNASIGKDLLQDRLFYELYFLCGSGEVSKPELKERYGTYGLTMLEKLVKLGVVQKLENGKFTIGTVRVNLDSAALKDAALDLVDSFFKPDLAQLDGNNFIGVFAEGLSAPAYREWLKIDEEAFLKKAKLSEDPKNLGSIRAFTVMVTDVLDLEKRESHD